ncbi:Hypothetical predicted protein [Mytilus galloprovincialis]|uniref:Uncharacterized protein n=1 Tax=Mytilus galloprovincialis TaxID=29158 RepID=A0A8B6DHA1_MYTGA|nr:Hypothetical predicted protein [Mytilus galloprovincialis]
MQAKIIYYARCCCSQAVATNEDCLYIGVSNGQFIKFDLQYNVIGNIKAYFILKMFVGGCTAPDRDSAVVVTDIVVVEALVAAVAIDVVAVAVKLGYNAAKCCGVCNREIPATDVGILESVEGSIGRCMIDGRTGVILDGRVSGPVHDETKGLDFIGEDRKRLVVSVRDRCHNRQLGVQSDSPFSN